MASSWARTTGSGLLWSGLGFAAGKLVTFVSILVLARLLAPSEFGVVAAITIFLALIELVSDLGMKAVVVYEQEEDLSDRVRTAFTVNLAFALILTGVGLLLAPVVAGFFRLEEESGLFRLAVLNLLLAALGNIHDSILLRGMDFRRRIRPEVARGAVRGGVAILLAALGLGAESLVWGLLAGTATWVLVLWAMVPMRPRLQFDASVARSMASYGGASAALALLSEIGRFTDATVIGRVLGERALGLYTVAARVPELLISSVAWQISGVLFPALSKRRATAESSIGWTTLELVRLQALYVVPVAAGLSCLGTALVVVLFSDRWADAGAVLAPLAIMAAFDTLLSPLGDGMKAIGRQRLLVLLNLLHLPVLIVAIIVASGSGFVAVAWTLAAVQGVFALSLGVAAKGALHIGVLDMLRAVGPAVAAGLGTIAGAGGVRLLWDDAHAVPVALAALAGVLGAVLALRLLAAATFSELLGVARGLVPGRAAG